MSKHRERQATSETSEQAVTQGLQSGDPRNPNADARPPRIPMGQGMNLDVSNLELDEENYKYRFFLDDPARPGKIQRAKSAYWEHATDPDGNNISRPSGASTQFLMKLPMEYWKQDLAAKKQKVLATMDTNAEIGDNEYAPDPVSGRAEGGTSAIQDTGTTDNPYS